MTPPTSPPALVAVHVLSLGCSRNEVDSEELAASLEEGGFRLVAEAEQADVAVVNTCGFVQSAKQESVDAVLGLVEPGRPVVAVGCLAERYGSELAAALPEAAVLGFDDYPAIAERLRDVLAGRDVPAHVPRDRRRLLPVAPAARPVASAATPVAMPGHLPAHLAWRRRLGSGPVAPLKLASGCDRRCSFCAIPSFRGSFVSRPPQDVLAEAGWLAGQGVRELFLVSENTTSYGKDLGDLRLLEGLLPQLAELDGVSRVRVSYLQPAELRPGLVEALTSTPGVAPYLDLSFQHASERVLRRMRRFGGTERFLDLLGTVRERCPAAGVRSNVIVGFPGETEGDLAELEDFLGRARLDVVGVFGYSDEDGTEASALDGHVDEDEVAARVARVAGLVDELVAQRAEDRCGELVEVLVESVCVDDAGWSAEGRGAHQGPDVDGSTTVSGDRRPPPVGDLIRAVVRSSTGADLCATALDPDGPAPP